MSSFDPLFPGMLLDATVRFAQDQAAAPAAGNAIAEMGWACTLVPEDLGGVGGGLADLASIVEGLATHGVQLPVVELCAVAPLLLQAAPQETAARWLETVCDGSATIAPLAALAAPLGALQDDIAITARQLDIGYELWGSVQGVDVSVSATHWVVPALLTGGEHAIFAVDAARMPAPTTRYTTMEGRRAADFTLASPTLPAAACIARGEAARQALARAGDTALLLTAVDTVAALAALLGQTVAYLNERRQFGVALSTFQALRHRMADMYVRYLAARGLLESACNDHDAGAADLSRTLALMKMALAESARLCAEGAIQMHGGMGLSEEVLATRLAQRLLASEFRYGDRLLHSARLLSPETRAHGAATHHNITRSAP